MVMSTLARADDESVIDTYLAERRAAVELPPVVSLTDLTVRLPTPPPMERPHAGTGMRVESPLDTPGFSRHYQRSSNPFADGYARTSQNDPGSAFNPAAINDPDNPLNPMNRYRWDNPMNPMNANRGDNPASPMNRGMYGVPFQPVR